jgi:hypothetical protein
MDDQLQLPLSIEDLYPVVSRSNEPETVKDNRVITELMQRFDLTEEEATEFYFSRINPPRRESRNDANPRPSAQAEEAD